MYSEKNNAFSAGVRELTEPKLFIGISLLSLSIFGTGTDLNIEGVSRKPGAKQLNLTSNEANSFASTTVEVSTADFIDEYANCPTLPSADIELRFTIEACPRIEMTAFVS